MCCDAEIDENDVGVFFLGTVENIFGFDVAMDDVVMMKVLDGGENGSDSTTGIEFGESSPRENTFEEFASGCFFEYQVVLSKHKHKKGSEHGQS